MYIIVISLACSNMQPYNGVFPVAKGLIIPCYFTANAAKLQDDLKDMFSAVIVQTLSIQTNIGRRFR